MIEGTLKQMAATGIGEKVKTQRPSSVGITTANQNGEAERGMTRRTWKTNKLMKIRHALVSRDETLFQEPSCRNRGSRKILEMLKRRIEEIMTKHQNGVVVTEEEIVIGVVMQHLKLILNGWTPLNPKNHSKLILKKISNDGKRR